MARTEALKESQRRYNKKIRQVMVKFNMETEEKILKHLESQDNMQAYIKSLIIQDMSTIKPERITKYDLIKASVEVRKEKDIKEGCTFDDEYPEVIEQFDTRRCPRGSRKTPLLLQRTLLSRDEILRSDRI